MTATHWLDEFFGGYYRWRPVNATFIGVHEHDGELPDLGENGAGDTVAEMRDLLLRSEGLEADAATPAERMDVRLARGHLRIQVREFESRHFRRGNPSLYAGEAVFGVMSLFLSEFAPLPHRVESAVRRMRAIPALLAQARETIERAPLAWTERAIRECRGAQAFFREGIVRAAAGTKGKAGAELESAAGVAFAAFAEYRSWLERELRGRESDAYACGEDMLSLYLREGHFLGESGAEIASYAESELAESAARLEAGARGLGAASAGEALAGLADLHPTADGYLDRYRQMWQEARDFAVDRGLLTWPDFPIRYVPRPAWARAAAPDLYFLFYRSPAAYHRPAVHDYLVMPVDGSLPPDRQQELLRATNDGVIKLNHVIHHGGIGHHVQNWHAFRAASRIGRIAAVDCASRIAMFCGGTMAEGWACYATDLMSEAGFLTPLERLAELQARVRMCARAVVDVRLHTGAWTLEEAARCYASKAGMPRAAAHAEAVKNSMFPGAALMYLVGTDAIHALRRELSARQGSAFDLRAFHDAFLAFGSLPVAVIAQEMKRTGVRVGIASEDAGC